MALTVPCVLPISMPETLKITTGSRLTSAMEVGNGEIFVGEQERERFLQDFNSQVVATSLPADSPTPAMHCNRHENHLNSPEAASICQDCYDQLQERIDVLEAAMHMDLHEAAQIVYDAVWSDPSDPSKTYQNAAQAILVELRRRSAITQVFGQLQPPLN